MMQNFFYTNGAVHTFPPIFFGVFPIFIIILVVWSLIWKGLALWKAAHRNEQGWFIALLLINTMGILDLLYYFLVGKNHGKKGETK